MSLPPSAQSIAELARAVGRKPPVVRRWLARESWPFAKTPPWDIEKVKAWMKQSPRRQAYESGEYGGTDAAAKRAAEIELLRVRTAREKLKNEAFRRKYVLRSEVARERVGRVAAVRSSLLQLPRHLATSLVGLEAREIEEAITVKVMDILRRFAAEREEAAE